MTKVRRIQALSAAFAALALVCSAPALAQAPAQPEAPAPSALFGLRPGLYGKTTLEKGHYQYAVNPGVSLEDSVEIFSFVDRPLDLRLYGADMEQTTNGGVGPGQKKDAKEVGTWLHLDKTELTLPPNGRIKVGFRTEVPSALKPGDYLGAFVAATVPPKVAANTLAVETRVALQVRVRIPGKAILASELGRLRVAKDGKTRIFTLEIENIGNLLQTIKGRVDLMSGGVRVGQVKLNPQGIYIIPRGKASFRGRWTGTPVFGSRTGEAVVLASEPAGDKREFKSNPVSMSFFSWLVVLIAIAGALVLIFIVWRRRRAGAGTGLRGGVERSTDVQAR